MSIREIANETKKWDCQWNRGRACRWQNDFFLFLFFFSNETNWSKRLNVIFATIMQFKHSKKSIYWSVAITTRTDDKSKAKKSQRKRADFRFNCSFFPNVFLIVRFQLVEFDPVDDKRRNEYVWIESCQWMHEHFVTHVHYPDTRRCRENNWM